MKLQHLAARDGNANVRIVEATTKLTKLLGLDASILDNLTTQRGTPAVRAMQQREAVADLLEVIFDQFGQVFREIDGLRAKVKELEVNTEPETIEAETQPKPSKRSNSKSS